MGDLAIRFEEVSQSNVDRLKELNRAIFSINYPERMYQDALACSPVTQLAFVGHTLVGAIACRLENTPQVGAPPLFTFFPIYSLLVTHLQGPELYIMTLGVLAPHRGRGIGSSLVRRCLAVVEEGLPEVRQAYLHVQISNEEAMVFYERLDFERSEVIENYYRRIDPPHAVVLQRRLGPPD